MSACCVRGESRGKRLARWAVPGTFAALLPKCPLCVAGWIGLTGVALPSGWMRMLLIAACVVSLGWAARGRRVRP